jgi:hypothetical protein
MSTLTINDYKRILDFYEIPVPTSTRILRLRAEKILASKLCRCIKKLDKKYKSRAVGICTKKVINNKNISRSKFSCTKKQTITLLKKNKTKKNK